MHQDGAGLWNDKVLAVSDQVFISIAMQKAFAMHLNADVKHVRAIKVRLWQVRAAFVKEDASYLERMAALRRMEILSTEMQLAEF